MKVTDFDYDLPPELIAQEPAARRDESRLLVLDRAEGTIEHRRFSDLPGYLRPGDIMVANDTRVRMAKVVARRLAPDGRPGGRVELLLLRQAEGGERGTWECLVRPGRRARPGDRLVIGGGSDAGTGAAAAAGGADAGPVLGQVGARTESGGRIVSFRAAGSGAPVDPVAAGLGLVPLPPYIKRFAGDPERYQTVYAAAEGSVAAPTAGLHFTPELIDRVKARGVGVVFLTLEIGLGTFRPVKVELVEDHVMHEERFALPWETAGAINRTRVAGGRVVAVGTTVTRALESAAAPDGSVSGTAGSTTMFIYPGYGFRAVDVLVTNFHLPRSTLLMLVCAFAGTELTMEAYRAAVAERYRFYSFGDAMLVV